MHETKSKWFKKVLRATLCFLVVCGISDILFSPCQFVVGDYYGSVQMEAVDAALAGHPALDLNTDVVYFSTGSLTYGSYYKTIGDHVFRTYI